MIDTKGMISVAEAAKRLNLSTEQVRRKLREGKLKGQRVGGQWFVAIGATGERAPEPLVSPELVRRIIDTREAIFRRNQTVFDVVEMLRVHREEH